MCANRTYLKVLAIILAMVIVLPSTSFGKNSSNPGEITASGTIKERGITTYMYGTHVLLDDNGRTLYSLSSDNIDLNKYIGRKVTVKGYLVKGYPVDAGPNYLNVKFIEMAILSFNERVNIAWRIVTEQYPGAVLYEADGTTSGGPTTDPARIDQLRVVFGNADNTTVIIKETAYGKFGKPQLIPKPWLGDVVIQWPVKMDLPQANKLKEGAGYTEPYSGVTLRNPLVGPTLGNPYFIFGRNPAEPYIFVDTVTGKVHAGN
jgi:hypothetical protein